MKARATRQSQKIMVSLVLILLAALCLAPAAAGGQEAKTKTLQVKIIHTGPPPTKMWVGDDPSHYLSLQKSEGKAVFSDGRKAGYQSVCEWDVHIMWFAEGRGYSIFTFKDGSVIVTKWQIEWDSKAKKGGYTFHGAGTITKGTGPYQGIKGTYQSTSRLLPPSKDHPKGFSETNAVLTYRLAPQ